MTPLRKLTFLNLAMLLLCIAFLIIKKYLISIVIGMPIIFLSIMWYKLIIEELVIYHIMRHGSKIEYGKIIELFGKKGKSAINRLILKNLIEQTNDDVLLKTKDYKFSMTKYRMNQH